MNNPDILIVLLLMAIPLITILCAFSGSKTVPESSAQARARRVNLAMSFDLSQASSRYIKETGLSEETAIRHETECRKFLALIAINRGITFGMHSQPVDEYWHCLIECTALYREFCTAIAGRFIDHDPDGGGDANYARTLNAYRVLFGEPPLDIWPACEQETRESDRVAIKNREAERNSDGGDFTTVPAMIFYSDSGSQDTGSHHSADGGSHSDSGSHSSSHSCGGHSCGGGSSCGGGH